MESVEYLIIGAGIAGLSTAAHLVLEGSADALVIDRERQAGFYSSSHNAAIGRQLTGTDAHTALTVEGRNRLAELGLIDSSGGALLAVASNGLDCLAEEAGRHGIEANRFQGSPYADCLAAETMEIPLDGVINIDGMLNWCVQTIKSGGASIQLNTSVNKIQQLSDGCLVETNNGDISAKVIINAAGGWAREIGSMASALPIAFKPMRRHLMWSAAQYPSDRPWVWWADRPFYMRPESGGLLMSPLDEVEVIPPQLNNQPVTDPGVLTELAETLRDVAPNIAECPINRLWCGLRTFAPDRKFVIGWDPVNLRLFWVAGLGGHGMTSGLAVGKLAATLIKTRTNVVEFDPGRFLSGSQDEE
jgi:glycine/D-amino acid oxidase-like deaminating enzyme